MSAPKVTGIDATSVAYDCGCSTTGGLIAWCPAHAAAPELLAVLEAVNGTGVFALDPGMDEMIRAALRKAVGQ